MKITLTEAASLGKDWVLSVESHTRGVLLNHAFAMQWFEMLLQNEPADFACYFDYLDLIQVCVA